MTDAVKMAKEALTDIRTSIECAAGCDEGIDPVAAVSEIMSAYGTAMASAYSRAADMVTILAALEQAGEPVSGIGHGEEADYAELKRLYDFFDDDIVQFTRGDMLTAIRHGKRLGQEFDAGEGGDAFRIMQEFYLSRSYDPNAERHADVVQAAIAFAISGSRRERPDCTCLPFAQEEGDCAANPPQSRVAAEPVGLREDEQ